MIIKTEVHKSKTSHIKFLPISPVWRTPAWYIAHTGKNINKKLHFLLSGLSMYNLTTVTQKVNLQIRKIIGKIPKWFFRWEFHGHNCLRGAIWLT